MKSIQYAKAIAKKENITSRIYVWPEDFDYAIYSYLARNNLIPENIRFTKISIVLNFIKSLSKRIFFLSKSLIILETIFLYKKSNKEYLDTYKYAIHMDEGLKGWNLNSESLIINKRTIMQKDILFINSEKGSPSWLEQYKKDNFNVLDFDKLPSLIKKLDLLSIYIKFFKLRLKILGLILKQSWAANDLFYLLKENILWDIFYKKFSIKKSISFMSARSIVESLIHKRNNTETIFIYFSTTENVLKSIDKPIVSHCHDYTHMYYDTLITNKISAEWIHTLQTTIKTTILIGPFFSDIIVETKKTKKYLLKNLGLDNYKKIIAYIDTPSGLYSLLSINAYKLFISKLIALSKEYPENCYLFKSKKSYSQIQELYDGELNSMLDQISISENILYVNNSSLSVYQAMGISDFIISGPKSSVVYEALHAHVPTICYDTSESLARNSVYHEISNCNAFKETELMRLHDFWSSKQENDVIKAYFEHVDQTLGIKSCVADNFQELRNAIENDRS